MKEITMYKTKDGKTFETMNKANAHEAALDFKKYYDSEDRLISEANYVVCADVLVEWLIRNKTRVMCMLNCQIDEYTDKHPDSNAAWDR